MGKKRRAWWVVGALVAAVALLAGSAFLSVYNSADARIDRAVAQIIEEYGFEQWNLRRAGLVKRTVYTRAPIDADSADEIVAILLEACPSYEYDHTFNYDDMEADLTSGRDPWTEVHDFHPPDEISTAVMFVPDDRGGAIMDKESEALLVVSNYGESSLWQRIKGLWPW